jgi:hypothetical protein
VHIFLKPFLKKTTQLDKLRKELKRKSQNNKFSVDANKSLSPWEQNLLNHIKSTTNEYNLNNVTRTKAYLDFYKEHQEIHWALLAHMVSRNGGWNMTDLQGEHLTRLLNSSERKSFFDFLERSNWLIFQDAYPQFILYKESLKQKKSLFYLLPFLNISTFMETIWDYFLEGKDSFTLTVGLIINEQNYLEKRVVQNPSFKNKVLDTLSFQLQDFLSFTHILFPDDDGRLLGQTVHHFKSLKERILIGKRLYTLLFQDSDVLNRVKNWAIKHPHSGSRKDYWPHIFNDVKETTPGTSYQIRLMSCQLKSGAPKIYSPTLLNAWKNSRQTEAEKGEWFRDLQVIDYLTDTQEIIRGEIKNEYCKTLEQLEIAALAKKVISVLDK